MFECIEPTFGIEFTKEQKAYYYESNMNMTELYTRICKVKPDKAVLKHWPLTPRQWRQCVMVVLFFAEHYMFWETVDNDTGPANTGSHRQPMTREEAYYIFGVSDIADGEIAFMTELCKDKVDLHRAACLVKARKADLLKYNLSEKQWRRCIAMAMYEAASDIFCYGM